MKKILNVACLVRVSHEEQVKYGYSLEAQKETLQTWLKDNGHNCAGWYIDEGVSARKKVKNRPALQRLLNDLQRGGIDLIIFTKLDRYFRSVSEYHETQRILELHNTHWKATEEDYDTTTTDGRFKINIMLSIAEQEADRTSDRIKFINAHKIKKRQAVTGKVAYGYKVAADHEGIKRVVLHEERAENAREIFSYFLKYNSVTGVTAYMNTVKGVKIDYSTIRKMLINPFYTGYFRGVDDYCPAIISREEFNRVQDIVKTRHIKRRKTNRVYIFSGLLRCPTCGFKLAGSFTKIKKSTGQECLFYRCNRWARDKSCTYNRAIAERKIEKWLLEKIRPELENYIAEIEVDTPAPVPVIDRAEITAEMERLNYMFRKNRMSVDEYEKEYSALEKKLETAEAVEPEAMNVETLREFLNSDILDIYGTLSREDKQAAWRKVIDKMTVDPDGDHSVDFLRP